MNLQWLKGLGALGVRLGKMVVVVLLIAIFNFMLVRAAPGDPALVMAGQSGATDEAFLQRVRAEYGLDQPMPTQLATYLGKVVRLTWAIRTASNVPCSAPSSSACPPRCC